MEIRPSPLKSPDPRLWQPRELALRGLWSEEAGLFVDRSSRYRTDERQRAGQGELKELRG